MRNDFTRSTASRRIRRLSLADAQALSASFQKSVHSQIRAAQRHLSDADVAYILIHGREIHRTGAIFHYLGVKDIPAQHRHLGEIMRLAGAVVLTSPEDEVITLYPHGRKLRVILRKMKYRFTPGVEVIGAEVEEMEEEPEE